MVSAALPNGQDTLLCVASYNAAYNAAYNVPFGAPYNAPGDSPLVLALVGCTLG